MVEEVASWLDPPPVARCSSRPSSSTFSSISTGRVQGVVLSFSVSVVL